MAGSLGLESGVVRLVEYDARWPALFAAEQQRIRDQCGTLALRLEHVGGTSIPGMCAKPVLDIAAGRPRDTPTRDYVGALKQAGYEQWVLARGKNIVPVVGARTRTQFAESLGSLQVRLSPAELARVEAAVPASAVAGARYDEHQMKALDSER